VWIYGGTVSSRLHRLMVVAGILAIAVSTACAGSPAASKAGGPGITDKEILLGTTLPLTGPAASAGLGLQAGMEIAVDEVNAQGGINGRKVRLEVLDDGLDQTRSVGNIRRLVDQDKVYVIATPTGGGILPASYDFIVQRGTPMWGPITPPDNHLKPVFLLGTSRANQDAVLIDYFASKGATKVCFIGVTNAIGDEALSGVNKQLAKHPTMKLVGTERIQPSSLEVSSAVLNCKNANPDVIIVGSDNSQMTLILQQVKKLGMNVVVAGDQGPTAAGGTQVTKPAGDAAEGLVGTLQTQLPNADVPAVAAWKKLAVQHGGDLATSAFSLQAYAYNKVLFHVLKGLGSDFSYSNFYRVAEALKNFDIGLIPPITCGPLPDGHTCGSGAAIAQVHQGAWVPVQGFTKAT
jgi:branched-chain amino acid transport system substrate-binding protein